MINKMADQRRKNTSKLFEEINKHLQAISYGSIEIYIQDNKVTQITVRKIKKTSLDLSREQSGNGNNKRVPVTLSRVWKEVI